MFLGAEKRFGWACSKLWRMALFVSIASTENGVCWKARRGVLVLGFVLEMEAGLL